MLTRYSSSIFSLKFFTASWESFLRQTILQLSSLLILNCINQEWNDCWSNRFPKYFVFFVKQSPFFLLELSIKEKVSCPYIIDRIFDAVPTKDFTQVLSTVLNRLRFAVVQEIVVIWKLCLYRWQFVDFHLKLIILHSGWS